MSWVAKELAGEQGFMKQFLESALEKTRQDEWLTLLKKTPEMAVWLQDKPELEKICNDLFCEGFGKGAVFGAEMEDRLARQKNPKG
jgi:hypothetical protein